MPGNLQLFLDCVSIFFEHKIFQIKETNVKNAVAGVRLILLYYIYNSKNSMFWSCNRSNHMVQRISHYPNDKIIFS